MSNQDHMHANRKHTSFLPVLTNYLQHLKAFVAKLAFFLTANILNSKDPISSDWITFLTIHSKNLKFRAKTTRCFDHTAVTYAAAEHQGRLFFITDIRLLKRLRVQSLLQTLVSKSKTFILRHFFSFV